MTAPRGPAPARPGLDGAKWRPTGDLSAPGVRGGGGEGGGACNVTVLQCVCVCTRPRVYVVTVRVCVCSRATAADAQDSERSESSKADRRCCRRRCAPLRGEPRSPRRRARPSPLRRGCVGGRVLLARRPQAAKPDDSSGGGLCRCGVSGPLPSPPVVTAAQHGDLGDSAFNLAATPAIGGPGAARAARRRACKFATALQVVCATACAPPPLRRRCRRPLPRAFYAAEPGTGLHITMPGPGPSMKGGTQGGDGKTLTRKSDAAYKHLKSPGSPIASRASVSESDGAWAEPTQRIPGPRRSRWTQTVAIGTHR